VDATLDKLEKEEEKVSANENCVWGKGLGIALLGK
jgi:hypothetical protein